MAKQITPSKNIKNIMVSFIAENKLANHDITIDRVRFFVLGASNFHNGQVKVFHPEFGVWVADYNKSGNLMTPKQIRRISTGAWELVK